MKMAVKEMSNLRGSRAWNPTEVYTNRKRNNSATRYTFSDGSLLIIYLNGDAAYDEQSGYGLQRWRNWHYCNTMGR
jgi:hypothetical protein